MPRKTSGPMLKTVQNQLNLSYLNTDEHTHLDRHKGNTYILDMAFISPNLSEHDIQFLIGDHLGSDHLPIEIAIDAQPHRNIHTNPGSCTWNDFYTSCLSPFCLRKGLNVSVNPGPRISKRGVFCFKNFADISEKKGSFFLNNDENNSSDNLY